MRKRPSHNIGNSPDRQLPVVLSPVADELLSSWISRHAAFYGVPPINMLQHCLPEATSLRAVDLQLTNKQAIRLARMFATDAKFVRGMTFANVPPISHRLIASKPIQFCPKCMRDVQDAAAFRRTQFLGWWLTCSSCGSRLRDSGEQDAPSPFRHYWSSALHGKKLIEDVSDKRLRSWASPIDIARLLLMRRIPKTLSSDICLERFRVLGAIIPEFDDIVSDRRISVPSAGTPILSLRLRPALLAGISIVNRHGPKILEMLHGHTVGENRTRFGKLVAEILAQNHLSPGSEQLQLI